MALTWQFITSIFNTAGGGNASTNNRSQALCCAGPRGVTLAITINTTNSSVSVWRSINGGQSWALASSGAIAWGGDMSLQWGGGTNWFVVASPGQYYFSTNDGSTWTSSSTNAMAPQCANAAAYDGNNAVVFQGISSGALEWFASSATSHTLNSGTFGVGNLGAVPAQSTLLWDGSNFVAINTNTAGTSQLVLTAPTGFTQGAGPVWTVQQTLSVPQLGGTFGCFGFVPGVGYLTAYSAGVNLATSYANILNQSGLQSPLGIVTTYNCFGVGNLFFVGNTAGAMAESSNGTSWNIDVPNFAVSGEYLAQAAFDPSHNTYIILGTAGSVCTGAIIPPFGRGLSAISPGQTLSPNNNVTAPAGFGGDRWGANGGGITPIGGGVVGLAGYDAPIAVTVSDCQRASNYIVVGGSQNAAPPITVIGAQANAALSAHTHDDSLPAGDSTLGNAG